MEFCVNVIYRFLWGSVWVTRGLDGVGSGALWRTSEIHQIWVGDWMGIGGAVAHRPLIHRRGFVWVLEGIGAVSH